MRLLIELVIVAGCYRPSVQPCQYACSTTGTCPEGLTCGTSGMCVEFVDDMCTPGDGDITSDVPATDCTLFAAPVTLPTMAMPRGVAIGKIDGNNLPDIVVAMQGVSSFTAFFGTGGGTFSMPSNAVTPAPTFGIAVINSAIGPEVAVVASSASVQVGTVYQFDGTAWNQKGVAGTGTGSRPEALAIDDLNADTLPDLAVATTQVSTNVQTFKGQTGGSLGLLDSTGTLIGRPNVLASAPLDGDALVDLVVGTENAKYQVARKDSAATGYVLGTPVDISAAAGAIALVDLDRDMKKDLLIASGSALQVGRSNGDGTFAALTTIPINTSPRGIAAGDFDRDGNVDIAVTSSAADTVTVFEGQGNGSFKQAVVIPLTAGATAWAIAAGDVDGDSFDDLVVTYSLRNEIAILIDTCTP